MDAVVICGGQGTRVRGITNDEIPKILIPIYDSRYKRTQPFLEYLVETLYSYGVRRMTLAAGFLGGVLQEYLEKRKYSSSHNPWMKININIEPEPLDTGGSVLLALERSGGGPHSDPFLVINGDTLILPQGVDCFEELYYGELFGKPELAMVTCNMEHNGQYGSLIMNGDGLIHEFKNGVAGTSWINCGWYIVRYSLFRKYYNPICNREIIQQYDVPRMSLERELFPNYLEEGGLITPIKIDRKEFLEIGSPKAIEEASKKLGEL